MPVDAVVVKEVKAQLEAINWRDFNACVSWRLRVPKCTCESCFKDWAAAGKRFYDENDKEYKDYISQMDSQRRSSIAQREERERQWESKYLPQRITCVAA